MPPLSAAARVFAFVRGCGSGVAGGSVDRNITLTLLKEQGA